MGAGYWSAGMALIAAEASTRGTACTSAPFGRLGGSNAEIGCRPGAAANQLGRPSTSGRRGCTTSMSADGAKQRTLGVACESAAIEVSVQVVLQRMVAGHLAALAPLLAQPHPEPALLDVDVLDPHP